MEAYYHAKSVSKLELKLDWLSQHVQMNFEKASTLGKKL